MLYRAAVVCLAALLHRGERARESVFFSVDAASPSVPGVSNNDVLAPGPVGGPPGGGDARGRARSAARAARRARRDDHRRTRRSARDLLLGRPGGRGTSPGGSASGRVLRGARRPGRRRRVRERRRWAATRWSSTRTSSACCRPLRPGYPRALRSTTSTRWIWPERWPGVGFYSLLAGNSFGLSRR